MLFWLLDWNPARAGEGRRRKRRDRTSPVRAVVDDAIFLASNCAKSTSAPKGKKKRMNE